MSCDHLSSNKVHQANKMADDSHVNLFDILLFFNFSKKFSFLSNRIRVKFSELHAENIDQVFFFVRYNVKIINTAKLVTHVIFVVTPFSGLSTPVGLTHCTVCYFGMNNI